MRAGRSCKIASIWPIALRTEEPLPQAHSFRAFHPVPVSVGTIFGTHHDAKVPEVECRTER
ncbi:Type IV secretion system protein VirB6, putative [Anopheles sinensis]|uniref:Type IV secretion system protein VirB6, putative n=1 Tax=Anopheles sinensis TaxID=74873 RepID=A0A084WRI3_ANOSI|nr:Type IV secretion system protein VirB6, putative [Anopheles sinensis]